MPSETRFGLCVLAAAVGLGVVADLLLRETPYGVNVLLWALAFLAALFALARWGKPLLIGTRRVLLVPLLASAALFSWRDSSWLTALNAAALLGSAGLCVLSVPGFRLRLAGVGDLFAAGVRTAGSALLGMAHLLVGDIVWREVACRARSRRLVALLRGVALALPLLLVFGALFAAADAVFGELLADAVPDVDSPATHVVVVLGWAWLSGGLLRGMLVERSGQLVRRDPGLTLGAVEAVVVLALLDLLFLAFVVVQTRYFFGGRAHVEATTRLTYAEYARHGFFELVGVAVLALPLLLAGDWLLRREPVSRRRPFRLLALVLVGLLFVVMISALQRMRLYQREYGLTELRVYTTAFMLSLAVVLVWFLVTVLRGRRELFAIGTVSVGFAAILALNAVNPDAVIARTNIERAREGKPIDVAYLGRLSDDAVPTLVRELPEVARVNGSGALAPPALARQLLGRLEAEGDWRTWNWSRRRADAAVRQHARELERLSATQR